MRHFVKFEQPATGNTRQVKVGWSWTLFFFSTWFGIPFHLRGVKWLANIFLLMALAAIAISVLGQKLPALAVLGTLVFLMQTVGSIWMGIQGNELTAKHYLSEGWHLVDDQSFAVSLARQKWGLNDLNQSPTTLTTPLATKTSRKPFYIAAGIVALAALVALIVASEGVDGLEIEQQEGFLVIRNKGQNAIKVIDVEANDRPECKPHIGIFLGSRFTERTVKVGDSMILTSPCSNVVRLNVKTDRGSATYYF